MDTEMMERKVVDLGGIQPQGVTVDQIPLGFLADVLMILPARLLKMKGKTNINGMLNLERRDGP